MLQRTRPPKRLARRLLILTLAALLGGTARAQLATDPAGLSVTVPQHETATRTVTLTNTSDAPLAFCVTFDRPLQRVAGQTRLASAAAGGGAPCGPYGEVLHRYDEEDLENDTEFGGWGPYSIVMTPDGRLFTAESGGLDRTFELTPELQYVGAFVHPIVAEFEPFPSSPGVTHDPEGASGDGSDDGTLWWINVERTGGGNSITRRILLLEGDFDGTPTGRRIEIVPPDEPLADFKVAGLSYDVATDRFYFLGVSGDSQDPANWRFWAVGRDGNVPEGYPFRPEPYPDGLVLGPDAHGGAAGGPGGTPGAEGIRLEAGVFVPFGPGFDRIVVVDRWGNSQGHELETPVPPDLFEGNGAGIQGNPLRSRIDPNGVMYMTFVNFDTAGIVGVRPHPLPPSWLVVDSDAGPEAAWDGTLGPGESREVILTFRAGAREIGGYTSALQAFDAASGEAVVVPLSLTVTQGTDVEDEAAAPEASSLTVHPNPTTGQATVTLVLSKAVEVRAAVYDVLGREVAVLHDGPLAMGSHRLAFDSDLPAGVYLVRVTGDGFDAAQHVTVVR